MPSKTKQLQTFVLDEDEAKFSSLLVESYKDIVFLDNNVWNEHPIIVESIEKCKTAYCYIWNRELFPHLPTIVRKDERIQGPSSGLVIQFQRCRIDDNGNLLSGSIAVGYKSSEKAFERFIKDVWKIFKEVTVIGVFHSPLFGSVDRSRVIKEYAVGKSVIEALNSKRINKLKHHSTEIYYVPV